MSAPPRAGTPLIELDGVSQIFGTRAGPVRAVEDLSLTIEAGQVLCLVGESGSGKTTTAKIIAGLRPPTSGQMRYAGEDIAGLRGERLGEFRRAVQIVHQDPYASLNPIRTIYQTLGAPLLKHAIVPNKAAAIARAQELLTLVGLTPAENFLHVYPHQLSGGQRQRVSVARALTLNPRVIIADEAVSMVDVSLRVSILNMLLKLREELGVTFVFITHDLAIAKYFAWSGDIGVMYLVQPRGSWYRDVVRWGGCATLPLRRSSPRRCDVPRPRPAPPHGLACPAGGVDRPAAAVVLPASAGAPRPDYPRGGDRPAQ